jgi:hypothetical protein
VSNLWRDATGLAAAIQQDETAGTFLGGCVATVHVFSSVSQSRVSAAKIEKAQ